MSEEDETPLDELCHKAGYKCGREDMLKEVLELLRGEEASMFAFSKYEETKCSKNDAHLTRHAWARWLENKLNEGKKE